jgi:hypothetical protein
VPRASDALMKHIYDLSHTRLPVLRLSRCSSVSIAIAPFSILILLSLDDQRFTSDQQVIFFFLEPSETQLIRIRSVGSRRQALDIHCLGVASTRRCITPWSSSHSRNRDECSSFHPLHLPVGPLVVQPGCESNQFSFTRYHSFTGCQ